MTVSATETAKSKKSNGAGKKNGLYGFIVANIDEAAMKSFIKREKLGKTVEEGDTPEQTAVALSAHFREKYTEDDLLECDRCDGIAPEKYSKCPFCGLEGEATEALSDETKAAIADEKKDATEISDPKAVLGEMQGHGKIDLKKISTGVASTFNGESVGGNVVHLKGKKKSSEKNAEATSTDAKGLKKKGSKKSSSNGASTAMTTEVVHASEVEVITEKTLDEAVVRVNIVKLDIAKGFWQLGQELLKINEQKLWKLRTDGNKKSAYTTFEQFVNAELKMTDASAYEAIKLAQRFTEGDVQKFGRKKLVMILKAPPENREDLKNRAETDNLTAEELRSEVARLKEASGYEGEGRLGRAGAKGAKKKAKKAAAKKNSSKKSASGKVTVAVVEGRRAIPLYAKPDSIRNIDFSKCKRAKTLDAIPFGKFELTNEVSLYIEIVKTDKGLQAVINTRRE